MYLYTHGIIWNLLSPGEWCYVLYWVPLGLG